MVSVPLFAIAASDSLILLFADIIGSHSNSLALLGAFTRIIHGKDVVKSEAAAELLAVYAMEHAALHAALQSDAAELYAAKLEAFVTLLSHNNESSTAKLALFELCLDSCAGDSKLQIELLVQLNDEDTHDNGLGILTATATAYFHTADSNHVVSLAAFLVAILMVQEGVVSGRVYGLLNSIAQLSPDVVYPHVSRITRHADSIASLTAVGDVLSPILFSITNMSPTVCGDMIKAMYKVMRNDVEV